MADEIFLSYSRSDKERAKVFAKAFDTLGFSVWWDRNIPHGRKFDEYILEKLNKAKCVIVLWSKDSVNSDWVLDEAERGKRRKILVPVLIDDVDIPLGFGRFQTASLIEWDGKEASEEFQRLSESIAGILGSSPRRQEIEIPKPEEEDVVKGSVKRKKEKSTSSMEKEEKTFTNSIGMKFTLIPAGSFMMGSEEFEWAKPVHKVNISNPFYLGIFPVRQKEWKAVMENNPSNFKGDNLPVENVSWDDVQEYIKKLNEKEKTEKYRLPSEAEWEYATRAGTKTQYFFGDESSELGDYAWYAENSGSRSPKKGDFFGYDKKDWSENKWNGKTHPVGQKESNPWGLCDVYGNVWEWVQDVYHDSYNGAPDNGSSWESGDGSDRVGRGGGWDCGAGDCRSAIRVSNAPGVRSFDLGFRLLRVL